MSEQSEQSIYEFHDGGKGYSLHVKTYKRDVEIIAHDWHGLGEGCAVVVFSKENCVALAKAILEWAAQEQGAANAP